MITILFAWDVRAKDLIHSLCLIQDRTNADIDRESLRLVIMDGRFVAIDIDCTVAELAGINEILPASIVSYVVYDEEGERCRSAHAKDAEPKGTASFNVKVKVAQ